MRHSFLLFPFFILGLAFVFSFPNLSRDLDYSLEWRKTDSLEKHGLYRQALARVSEIYKEAKRDHDSGEELKALIYKLRYINVLSEEGFPQIISELEKERDDERITFKALKSSMLAELYTRFYQRKRWQIFKNSSYDNPDLAHPETWSPAQFGTYINDLVQESISRPGILKSTDLDNYQRVLQDSLPEGNELTLLDLLSQRALDFYKTTELDYSRNPLPDFLLDSMLFSPRNDFLKWLEAKKDSISFMALSLEIFGGLLSSHLDDWNKSELISIDLKRVSYAYDLYLPDDRDQKYLNALERMAGITESDELKAEIFFDRAQFHFTRSGKYRINLPLSKEYRNDRKEALAWAQKAIDHGPDTRAAIQAENLISRITAPSLNASTEKICLPNRHILLSVDYANLEELWYWITPVSPGKVLDINYRGEKKAGDVFVEGNNPVASGQFTIPDHKDYNQHRVTLNLPPLFEGNYQLVLSGSSNPDNKNDFISESFLRVSNLAWLTHMQEDGKLIVHIVDRGSGNPVSGASVKQYFRYYDNRSREENLQPGAEFISDRNGKLIIGSNESLRRNRRSQTFHLLFGSKEYGVLSPERFHLYTGRNDYETRPSVRIFTDRGIYRPGQEVLFTGLLVINNKKGLKADKGREFDLFFQDSKFKHLDTLKLETDDFGFFSGSFTIPEDALGGRFQLVTPYGRQGLQVEQYKRPGFKISVEPDNKVYFPGDSIFIKGQGEAFAGINLAGASVEIEAYMNLTGLYPARHYLNSRKIRIADTKFRLDSLGRFAWGIQSVGFLSDNLPRLGYEFLIKIKDNNGETLERSHHIILSKQAIQASVNGPQETDRKQSATWEISAMSPGGRSVNTSLLVRIGLLHNPDIRLLPNPVPDPDTWVIREKAWNKIFPRIPFRTDNRQDSIRKMFYSEVLTVNSGGYKLTPEISKWGTGRYRILISRPEDPDQIIGQYDFDVFDSKRKDFPLREALWLNSREAGYKPGQNMEYSIGARYPGLYKLEISGKDSIYVDEWISLDNRLKKRKMYVSDDMQGDILIQLNGVYENNHFHKNHRVNIPWINKNLRVAGLDSLPVLEPGEPAKLELKIVDEYDNPVSIQGALAIYDSSLDEIYATKWFKFHWPVIQTTRPLRSGGFGLTRVRLMQSPAVPHQKVTTRPDASLNWFGLDYFGIRNFSREEMVMAPAARSIKTVMEDDGAGEPEVVFQTDEGDPQNETQAARDTNVESLEQALPPYFRKDFRETACFVSSFKTDKEGRGVVSFTVPEALTRWKVKIYGHNGEMAQALQESVFQSSKRLMLLPNFPRFVREGDKVELEVKLAYEGNQSTSALAEFRVEGQYGGLLEDMSVDLSLVPGEQKSLSWNFIVPDGQNALQIKLSCNAGEAADGVSVQIPVLPGRLNFWESRNFFMRDPDEISLSSGRNAEKAVLELNTEPLWLAVQSMPVFTDRGLPCSELWFNRYFTARMIKIISQDNPLIRERLVAISGEMESDPRLNPYLRNKEMRRFVLESGLWEGADEEEALHLKALAESFVPGNNSREIETAFDKMAELQLEDGSWPWFRGMRPDFRMSLHIMGGLGELALMDPGDGNVNSREGQIIRKGVEAIDRAIYERYNRQKLAHPDSEPGLSGDIIHYLYVRSFFSSINFRDSYKEAYKHYFEKAGNEWLNWSVTQQAFIALSYYRAGSKDIPGQVLNSLLDRSLQSDGGGIFWKMDPRYVYWYNRDIWQQSRLIELFATLPQGKDYLDDMRTWLIQQKRSRDWGDRISTVLAVKSLILYGSDWYSSKPSVSIHTSDEYFSPLRLDLGTDPSGHYRYSWDDPEILEDGLNLSIEKEDKLPVWGSLFINKTIELDSLDEAGSDLTVRRTIMVETDVESQIRWIPIEAGDIHAGRRIRIRLEIEASQAVDYVQLRDYRPAAFEPDKSLSGYRWGHGTAWYQTNGDQFTDFYIPHLPKGFSYFEYNLYAEQAGAYSGGYAEIQSQYAPEFLGRSKGGRINVLDD